MNIKKSDYNEKKKEIWLSPMTKTLIPTDNFQCTYWHWHVSCMINMKQTANCTFPNRKDMLRQKGGDLTQSYDKSPYTNRNVKGQSDNTTPQKSSIKQQLRTDLGRSVGVTTATRLVWFTRFTGPNLHTHRNSCVIEAENMKIFLYSDIRFVKI